MENLKEIAKGRWGVVFLALLLAVKVGSAMETEPSQDSLGSEVYPMEICNNIWMYNDKDYWIEIHDFIPCPDNELIWPQGDSFVLTIHTANEENSTHLAYSFFIIADPHIGDVNNCEDYSGGGPAGDYDPDNPCSDGSYPGRHLEYAIQEVNERYKQKYRQGVEQEEPIFCLIAGDLSNRAEKAELQHAKIYLDELLVPWVPIMGNHDTWV